MPSNFAGLTVTWFDQSDAYATSADITSDVKSIPLFTDTGTGEVNSAKIVLRALDGNYIVSGNKIKKYDRFSIIISDLEGNVYTRTFEVVDWIPSQAKSEGVLLTVECVGIEYHTQQVNMAAPYWFEDAFTVMHGAAQFYNDNRGTEQPYLDHFDQVWDGTTGNGLPFYTSNIYEYGLNEDRVYNRMMDVIEKLGSAVSTGGALTFYELSFTTSAINTIKLRARASGDNTPTVTIKNAKITSPQTVGEQEGLLSNPTGTNVMAWGSDEHGSLPTGFSKYDSNLMFFQFRPDWATSRIYAVDSKIKVTTVSSGVEISKHYVALEAHTSGVFATDLAAAKWSQIDMKSEFGDTVQYSPWTDDKATLWGNCGADPDRSTFSTGAWFDINCVVWDNSDGASFFRTWVDGQATNDAGLFLLADNGASNEGYSYDHGDIEKFPDGFRVLVSGTGSGDLTGFDNMVVEYARITGTTYNWRKLYEFGTGASDAAAKAEILVIHEGKVYEGTAFNSTPVWTAKHDADYGNDCVHPYTTAPANDAGVDLVYQPLDESQIPRSAVTDSANRPDITDTGVESFDKNVDSAVKFVAVSSDIADSAIWLGSGFGDPDNDWFKNGIGCNFRFPFPNNNYNAISEDVGELYGGGGHNPWITSTAYTRGNIVEDSGTWYLCTESHTSGTLATDVTANKWRGYFPEPGKLDIQNMNYTADGKRGFNWGASSEDLGQISAVAFWIKFSQTLTTGGAELNDEHRFRAWFCDSKDNIVYQDFSIGFSNNFEDVRLPVSGFRIYRGRKPLYGFDAAIAAFVPPKELEIINIFEWRNIKIFGIQYQPQYDEYGRFNPAAALVDEGGNSVTWANLLGVTRSLWVDGFRFIKPLLATSGEETTRNMEPDFLQRPNTTLYHQLQNDAKSQLEIEKFEHKEYNIETSGDTIFDIPFGDSFILHNDKLVDDANEGESSLNANDGNANTIRLVAKRIEYSLTKPSSGKGGLRRRIKGAKVFT